MQKPPAAVLLERLAVVWALSLATCSSSIRQNTQYMIKVPRLRPVSAFALPQKVPQMQRRRCQDTVRIVDPAPPSTTVASAAFKQTHVVTNQKSLVLHGSGDDGMSFTASTNVAERWKRALQIAIGPALLLGGTAKAYSDAAGTSLLPIAAASMLLMACQAALQPRVAKIFIPTTVNKEGVALVEEIVKTLASLAILIGFTDRAQLLVIWREWSLKSSLIVAGLPAIMYAAQGVLTYVAYQGLDPLTFNGLMQTKTLSAALFCFLLLGRKQSALQMVALCLLTLSALVFQGTLSLNSMFGRTATSSITKEYRNSSQQSKNRFLLGVVPCLMATSISGLAGTLSQKGLQLAGEGGRNAFLYTVEISFFSAVCLLVSISRRRIAPMTSTIQGKKDAQPQSLFQNWTPETILPICLKAFGGILTALIHKYADSVTKGFALVLGLVLTGVIQAVLDSKTLSLDQAVGTSLVLLSSWLHFKHPAL